MARRKGKRKGKRRGYSRKRKGGHKSKKIPMATAIGAALGAHQLLFVPAAGSSKGIVQYAVAKDATLAQKETLIMNSAKNINWSAVLTPLVGGIAISMIAGKVGANKYVAKVPLIGKKVKF